MAAEIARQVLNTHFDDEEDTFDYVLALALDGEDVTPFLVEACDDDEEAAAALAAAGAEAPAGDIASTISPNERKLPSISESTLGRPGTDSSTAARISTRLMESIPRSDSRSMENWMSSLG